MATSLEQAARRALRPARRAARRVGLELEVRAARRQGNADLAIFHEFAPPPSGGGNQFLTALAGELERRGVRIERNVVSATTRACLFNSYNFDSERLERFARDGVRMVHRVDGPLGVYRGFDDGTDDHIAAINRLADATVFQSRYSLEKHRELGYELVDPRVVHNAVDPSIFHRGEQRAGDRIRVISVSWSVNPNKGGATYAAFDEQLDRSRYEYTFVGQSSHPLPHARTVEPIPSHELADVLREHDVFLTASRSESCPNALLEAFACGLPALALNSGSHPELVGDGGLLFDDAAELSALLDLLAGELDERRAAISTPALGDVADEYLDALGLDARG
jgi:glycosyltransferase involved in cell wall biosynthesis